MKKAFSLIELIFVIIILGILSSAAVMSIPDNHLYSDIHFVTNKIKEKQMDAMLYDVYEFSNTAWRSSYHDSTCIDTQTLIENEKNSKDAKKYRVKSTLSASKICFDALGRPYKNNYTLNNLIKLPIVVDIAYKSSIRKITIMPYSGSIIIKE